MFIQGCNLFPGVSRGVGGDVHGGVGGGIIKCLEKLLRVIWNIKFTLTESLHVPPNLGKALWARPLLQAVSCEQVGAKKLMMLISGFSPSALSRSSLLIGRRKPRLKYRPQTQQQRHNLVQNWRRRKDYRRSFRAACSSAHKVWWSAGDEDFLQFVRIFEAERFWGRSHSPFINPRPSAVLGDLIVS